MINLQSNELLQYRRERLPLRLVLTVALLLTMTAAFVSVATSLQRLASDWMLAILLVCQFRLWDDLHDVDSDRIKHPHRVLCRQTSLRQFQLAVVILFVINSTAIFASRAFNTAIVFVATNIVFFIWYHKLRSFFPPSMNTSFVLSKYPAFLFLLVNGSESRQKVFLAIAMIIVFAAACAYEVIHNMRT